MDLKELQIASQQVFLSIYYDMRTCQYGLHITDGEEFFGILMDKTELLNLGVGGIVENEQLIAVRNYLTDLIKKRRLE